MASLPEAEHQRRRRSLRLSGFDYAQVGAYFITLGAQGRACLFGEVGDGEMRLNDAGRVVVKWWKELESKFPNVTTDAHIVMPNHFHGIIFLGEGNRPTVNVGADT